ncbi:hypothetical protein VTN02DRAFT_5602 [Thermoascus thermophilus]
MSSVASLSNDGDLDLEELISEDVLALAVGRDTTAVASMTLAAVILLAILVDGLPDLMVPCHPSPSVASVLFAVIRSLCAAPIRAAVSVATPVCSELCRVRSPRGLGRALLDLRDRVVVKCRLYRYAASVVSWFLPVNEPLAMLLRWFGLFVAVVVGPPALMLPALQYLFGLRDGLFSGRREVSGHCVSVMHWFDTAGVSTQRQWLEIMYCLGEEAGLEWNARLQDDMRCHPFFNGEICHVYSLLFAIVVVSVLTSVYLLSADFSTEAVASPEHSFLQRPITEEDIGDRTVCHAYEVDLDWCKKALETKNEELRCTMAMLRQTWAHNKRLAALRVVADRNNRPRRPEPSNADNDELRRNVDQLQRALREARDQLRRVEDDTARRSASHREEVADWERRLAESEERVANALSEGTALRIELQAQTDKTAAAERRLADQNERHRDRIEGAQAQELAALSAKYDALQGSYGQLSEHCRALQAVHAAMEIVKRERDEAAGRIVALQAELEATQTRANEAFAAGRNALEEAQGSEMALRQQLQSLQSSVAQRCCDIELEALSRARSQAAEEFARERQDLERQVARALQDAERSHRRAEEADATVRLLEHRLARFEAKGSLQEIPKRHLGDLGSIQAARENSEVTIAEQLSEIASLQKQIAALKAQQGPADERWRAHVEKLRRDLAAEKTARTNDLLRLGRENGELRAERQKLQISLSNAEAALGRRGRGSVTLTPNKQRPAA